MTRLARRRPADLAREIAPDVFCLGPWGRTQTNVYFVRAGSSGVLIDAGWANDAARIERAAGSLFGARSHPAAILLTHDHPDHEGSALRLARSWGCRVYLHPAELPIATRDFAAIQRLARLEPAVLAGGHGQPMTGPETARAPKTFAGLDEA